MIYNIDSQTRYWLCNILDEIYDEKFDSDDIRNEIPVIEDDRVLKSVGKTLPEEEKRLEIRVIDHKNKETIKEEIEESSVSVSDAPKVNWTVKFYTKEIEENTKKSQNIILKIVGDKAKSRKYKFSSLKEKAFQRGKVESFKIQSKDIGSPKQIIVTNTGDGDVPELRLKKVEIYSEAANKLFVFLNDKWIEKDQSAILNVKTDQVKRIKNKFKKKKRNILWIKEFMF